MRIERGRRGNKPRNDKLASRRYARQAVIWPGVYSHRSYCHRGTITICRCLFHAIRCVPGYTGVHLNDESIAIAFLKT
jgi:hypothetical protein